MRAFVAAVIGLAAALALVFAITAFGVPEGETSPKPLLTTAPPRPESKRRARPCDAERALSCWP